MGTISPLVCVVQSDVRPSAALGQAMSDSSSGPSGQAGAGSYLTQDKMLPVG